MVFEDAAAEVGTEAEDSFGARARAITRFLAAKYTAVHTILCSSFFTVFGLASSVLSLLRLCARLCSMCVDGCSQGIQKA